MNSTRTQKHNFTKVYPRKGADAYLPTVVARRACARLSRRWAAVRRVLGLPTGAVASLTAAALAGAGLVSSARAGDTGPAARTDAVLIREALQAVSAHARSMTGVPAASTPAVPGTLTAPRLTLAVSTSLAPEYRRALARETARAGIRLAVRGLPVPEGFEKRAYFGAPESERRTAKAQIAAGAQTLHAAFGAVEIDPAFFRRNGIEAVPVLVLEDEAGPVARVHGAVTLRWALEAMWGEISDPQREKTAPMGAKRLTAARDLVRSAGCRLAAGRLGAGDFAGMACDETFEARGRVMGWAR